MGFQAGTGETKKSSKYAYVVVLFLILLYFTMAGFKADVGALISPPFIGRMLGRITGTFASGLICVYPYLIMRRIFLKIGFPSKAELIGLILFSMIIITAVKNIPK